MRKNNGLVVVPNNQGELKIPEVHFTPLTLDFTTRQMQTFLSLGDPRFDNNLRKRDPAILFLDRGLPNSEKRHHLGTFVEGTKTSISGLLENSEVLEIDDKGVIQLPANILELFSDTNRRARILTLNGKGAKLEGLALSFQAKHELGSNGR